MLDEELRALVSVDPSPHFEARVRAHVNLAGRRGELAARWLLPALAAAAMVVVVGYIGIDTGPARNPLATLDARVVLPHAPLARPLAAQAPHAATRALQPVDRQLVHQPSAPLLNPAEIRALQQLFASPPQIVDAASFGGRGTSAIEIEPLDIPELSVAPLVIDPVEGEPHGQ